MAIIPNALQDMVDRAVIDAELEDIKAELKKQVTEGANDYQLGQNAAIMRCFQIINKHIREGRS